MPPPPRFDQLRPSDQVVSSRASVDAVQSFFFSAAEYMGHRIHYDHIWSTEVEGHPSILVSTSLIEAMMYRFLSEWAGSGAWISRLSFENRDKAYPDEEMIFDAVVLDARLDGERQLVDLKLKVERADGALIMLGQATVIMNWR